MSHPLYIAFIWHMHQPYYRDMVSGECTMPWVRLHGTKDYLDMVSLLADFPNLHQTFNLVPSLIDQLEEYGEPGRRSDHLLELSRKPAAELTDSEKRAILEQFFMANVEWMIKPHGRYDDLFAKRGTVVSEADWPGVLKRFKTQDYLDLQVWFNLVWVDPWLRQQEPTLAQLEAKGSRFTESEKQDLLDRQLGILARIIPAYREAQARGQVELTTSPYYHPILPLVCDLKTAHVALPHLVLPEATFRHPEDARWQLGRAIARHEQVFGRRPAGMWPPEGSVSEDVVRLAIEHGLRWIATDEEILWRTVKTARSPSVLYRPHLLRRKGGSAAIVFRDRELSDLIGFVYSQWRAPVAAQDFIKRLERIQQQVEQEPWPALVTIILDGENAWEFYPDDAHEFFRSLYGALANDLRFRLVTVSEFLDGFPLEQTPSLPPLFAGSWIDGNFATWIGHPEKNMAWTLLAKVREDLEAAGEPTADAAAAINEAWRSFHIAEGSDWEWWLGDTHSSAQDHEFDRLFRAHLGNVYRAVGREVPAILEIPIRSKVVQPVYEPTAPIHPTIDGVETTYYEWLYAGCIDLRKGYAAIQRSQQALRAFYYGYDETHWYVRIDADPARLVPSGRWALELELIEKPLSIRLRPGEGGELAGLINGQPSDQLRCAFRRTIELAVPRALAGLDSAASYQLQLTLYEQDEATERYPTQGAFRLNVPSEDFAGRMWSV